MIMSLGQFESVWDMKMIHEQKWTEVNRNQWKWNGKKIVKASVA